MYQNLNSFMYGIENEGLLIHVLAGSWYLKSTARQKQLKLSVEVVRYPQFYDWPSCVQHCQNILQSFFSDLPFPLPAMSII